MFRSSVSESACAPHPVGAAQASPLPPLRVGLLGLGTVGGGTHAVLRRNHADIERRTGRRIVVTHVAARNTARAAALVGSGVQVLADAHAVATHPDVDVVVEAVGGTQAALGWVTAALAAGKHVVTANKALLAQHGHTVFDTALRHDRVVAFEGAVAVAIPIIKALREGLGANRIEWLAGIINGTSNYVLTLMREQGLSLADAVAQAQALGYAEADPSFDVEGVDAAHKLTLLAAVAFGMPLRYPQVHVQGITALTRDDMLCAEALGYRIKLLGIARRHTEAALASVELRVHPALVPASHLLAGVNGALNGIVVKGDASGPTVHCGAGAGGEETASAVVADLMDIARLQAQPSHARVPSLGVQPWAVTDVPVLPMAAVRCPHFLRIPVADTGTALAQVAQCLIEHGVPVAELGSGPAGLAAPALVVLTQMAPDGAVQAALTRIQHLPGVSGPVTHIRVERLGT